YATSDTPLRFFDKAENTRIIVGNGSTVTGPGHCNYFRSPENGEIYIAYHVHTVPPNTDNGRSLAIDRLVFNPDGTLAVDGPSENKRPLPSGINGFVRVEDCFTYSADGLSNMNKRSSAVENVFDKIAYAGMTDILTLSEGGSISIKFDKPTSLYSVWVYPSYYDTYKHSADIIINGEYTIKDVKFNARGNDPAVFVLDKLPSGVLVEELKIVVHVDPERGYAILSEVEFIDKK
ncbi:MAG: hypothetical protein IKU61_07210, partial [Clostridia bacterium]|nr:hypothetical protein [Clostridia bacterium]